MMAVGDEEELGLHDLHDFVEHAFIGDAPKPLPKTHVVLKVDAWFYRGDRLFDQG